MGQPEIQHRYGKNVHILSDVFLSSHLARLCSPETKQPVINELITTLYSSLLKVVVNNEFPHSDAAIPTRMITEHKEAVIRGAVIDPETPVVTVNLARAGTLPSHVCYSALNYFMNPDLMRQDHISIARKTNEKEQVTGSLVSGHKIGGGIKDTIVIFPDPMGATGSTIIEAVDLYKQSGTAKKYISMHCIITPEYLNNVLSRHPDLIIYAVRLDRGLSAPDVLKTMPGERWSEEKGLNSKQYIVPGGGGFGEILNNSYV